MIPPDRRTHHHARLLFIDVAILWARPKVRTWAAWLLALAAFLLWLRVFHG